MLVGSDCNNNTLRDTVGIKRGDTVGIAEGKTIDKIEKKKEYFSFPCYTDS
jgi:hypothetical protein